MTESGVGKVEAEGEREGEGKTESKGGGGGGGRGRRGEGVQPARPDHLIWQTRQNCLVTVKKQLGNVATATESRGN